MTKKSKHNKALQQVHNQEFRETAIKLALTGNKAISEVAGELGLAPKLLYSWVSAWKKKNGQVTASNKNPASDELQRLQKRNKQLELEVEILKKAAAYFAKTLL
jgi:transposase